MDVTQNHGTLVKVPGPTRLGKHIGPAWTSYADSSLDRAVGYRSDSGTVETVTNSLPFKFTSIVELDDDELVLTTLIVDRFGNEEDDSLRLGVSSIKVEVNEKEDQPLNAEGFHRVPIHRLLLVAVMAWSHNSDGSPVTIDQAQSLVRRGGRRRKSPEEDWRTAADAYLAAKEKGEPTTVAVARALGKSTGKQGQDAARSLIRRARQAGYLPPITRKD
ncbi:MAG TPA: DUF6214 family protein [Acidimicrobiales bacterium]|nr:DUF6214 family protein [Acidimicrobiales bacterium]